MLTVKHVKYAGAYNLRVSLSNWKIGLFNVGSYIIKLFIEWLANEGYLKQVYVDSLDMA